MKPRQHIDYSHNWNHKLDCDCYTTIRLWQPERYYPGAEFDVSLKGQPHHVALVQEVRKIKLADISDFMARVDAGLPKGKFAAMLRSMYKAKVENLDNAELALVLFIKDHLFIKETQDRYSHAHTTGEQKALPQQLEIHQQAHS